MEWAGQALLEERRQSPESHESQAEVLIPDFLTEKALRTSADVKGEFRFDLIRCQAPETKSEIGSHRSLAGPEEQS
jgi:hypothetical protein